MDMNKVTDSLESYLFVVERRHMTNFFVQCTIYYTGLYCAATSEGAVVTVKAAMNRQNCLCSIGFVETKLISLQRGKLLYAFKHMVM